MYFVLRFAFILWLPSIATLCASHCEKICQPLEVVIEEEYDYIIVGAGSAASILAQRLTDETDNSVLVLEWGQDLRDDPQTKYLDGLRTSVIDNRYSENYFALGLDQPDPFFFNVWYSIGRTVGGSSLHAIFATRASPQFFDALADIGGNHWTYKEVLPLLNSVETFVPCFSRGLLAASGRGNSGPLQIIQFTPGASEPQNQELATIFRNKTAEWPQPILNIECDDYNNGQNTYVSSNMSQYWLRFDPEATPNKKWIRSNTLHDIWAKITNSLGRGLNGRKLRLMSESFVEKVLIDKDLNAYAIQYLKDSQACTVKAKKKIILAAGTLRTPLILEQSGVGDPTILALSNLPLILANNHVGKHMRDHIYLHFAFDTSEPSFNFNVTARLKLELSEFNYPTFILAPKGHFNNLTKRLLNFNSLTQTCSFAIPIKAEGEVHNHTNNSGGLLYIDMPFFKQPEDILHARMAAKYFKRVIETAAIQYPNKGYRMVYPPESAYTDVDGDLDVYLTTEYRAGIHQTGTCRMGKSQFDSVVNGHLHVHGIKNLMIADLSVIPLLADANTNDLAFVIGEMAAKLILEEKH